jgi:hypothetical protein
MPAAANAYVIKDGLVTIDSVEYANQCRIAQLTPDQPIQTYRTMVPDGAQQDVDSASWTFDLTGLQINATGGLAKALRALAVGEQVDVVLAPRDLIGDDKATFTIVAVLPPFGGEQGSYAEIEMSFPVVGQPVFSAISA